MSNRYAIYYAPPADSALSRFGDAWLGRSAELDRGVAQPRVAGIDPQRLAAITAAPRHYGFHATLKPPFQLAEGRTAEELHHAAAEFARGRAAFTAAPLALSSIGGFLALVPARLSPALQSLAADCVSTFDEFRAPPLAEELAGRRAAGLSERQEALLERWGYPYVMEEFRFHLTLTERLAEPERSAVRMVLEPLVAPFAQMSLRVDAVAVFLQEEERPFRVVGRYPLAG